jgi:hypothetical protein
MSGYEFTMSLRIRHPDIEPATITRTLGLEPRHSWRAGDIRQDASGSALDGTYHESYWMCELMPQPELSTDHVGVESELLRALGTLRRSFGFLQSLRDSGGVAELHVSIFAHEEFRIEFLSESFALLGRMGLTMAMEVSPHSTSRVPTPVM